MSSSPIRRRRAAVSADRFEGWIAGLGTASGLRAVVGIWPRFPLGSFADAMVERTDGRAQDLHVISAASVRWEGADRGAPAPVDPPVRVGFGFGSTPRAPSFTRVTTIVRASSAT